MSTAFDTEDPIAATASAPGAGLRGIVRVSGPGAWRIALAGFGPKSDAFSPGAAEAVDFDAVAVTRRPSVVDGLYRLPGMRPLLPASVALWPAPRTYTGQELAEIHAPGSPPLLERLLAHVLAQGARPAKA